MSARKVLAGIKEDLQPYVGTEIRLKANRGRKKIVEKAGVLESTYPNIFVVKVNERSVERRISFSYADILTEAVILTVSKEGKDVTFIQGKA
ncbi:Uncharacterized protein Veg [Desulfonispora thiosulfatigenes DSM 11270]|uniref:Uncharacterized protein Veg n=1 Tax=Desulfonispora thiosulfatigenes DSM 11270 TaxID=656914 RepID=A0A1W1V0I6_DESTI|nr:Veg family protein [Desulfonispora thiosulfatigenes]SMB86837.1 Uncharacterized protein Veg [Desulfonispora thiosulfatigenes DSM 11270]